MKKQRLCDQSSKIQICNFSTLILKLCVLFSFHNWNLEEGMAAQISFIRERIANFCNEILVPINLPPRLRNIFDPLEETPYKWTLVWVSIISTLLDPMFFYIFLVNDHNKCLRLDTNLMIAVCLLRFLVDSCHLIFIFYHERRRRIFFVVLDVLCILPVPQVIKIYNLWIYININVAYILILNFDACAVSRWWLWS